MTQKSDTASAADVTLNTYSGRAITPLQPQPDQFTLEDIANGTAQVCRCSGQTVHFYSVALHSIYVSKELAAAGYSPRVQLLGLLHDASEAYIADVPGPVKAELPQYREIEEQIQCAVYEAFDIGRPERTAADAVERADRRLRRYELPSLLPDHDWEFCRPELGYDLTADSSSDVAARFIARAGTLVESIDSVQ